VFGSGAFPELAKCTAAPWGGSVLTLARIVMEAALLDQRPGVFISYLRNDASVAADQIHDELRHIGYRVFLDHFSGTPGHLFPSEIAEAMTEMDAVLVLETQNLRKSKWTMWEAIFAHRYRIGPLAVNFLNSPQLQSVGPRRHSTSVDPSRPISSSELNHIIQFVRDQLPELAVARRAYYETLIRLAARSRGGTVSHHQNGVLTINDGQGVHKADALASGVPARLRHAHRIADASSVFEKLIAGEHHHLQSSSLSDLQWLVGKTGLRLVGSASVYRIVRQLV